MGGGGMGPISVTPIGGSGKSVMGCTPPALAEADWPDGVFGWLVTAMTGDRLGGCDPTAMLVVEVDTVVELEAAMVVVVGEAIEMTGNVAARPGNFDMMDGEPEPVGQFFKIVL